MKSIETQLVTPFATATWRWITPLVSGAALGAVALAIPSVRELFSLKACDGSTSFCLRFSGPEL